jgi:hypothetical protein
MANGFAGQTLQVGSETAVSSFDVGGEGFSDDLFFGRQHFLIGFELVGAEKADDEAFDFWEQSLAGAWVAFADVKSQGFALFRNENIPTPSFLVFLKGHIFFKSLTINFLHVFEIISCLPDGNRPR